MKVLLIDVNCKSSSTGQIVYNLYSYLNEHGDEAAVCYGRGEKIIEKNIFKFGLDWETYLHALLTRITGYTGCFSFFSTRRLIRFIERFDPDVVHIHELHAYFVNIKQLLDYLAKKKIKVIHTLHCEFSYTGKCGHSVECERWKSECGHCPHLKDYPATLFFDHTRHMIKVKRNCFAAIDDLIITTPSQWLADRAKESFFRDREIKVIHNGIDTSVFYPRNTDELRKKHRIDPAEKIVLAVAPDLMSENKGGKYVLALAERLKEVRFILIGANEKPYEWENVISLGPIYDKDLLAQYYTLADVFVICSKRENYPTTCMEAVCCGTPVVGFDVGGIREATPGKLGQFVPYGQVEELKAVIEPVISFDYRSVKSLFEEARQKSSITRMCDQYLELLN